MTHTTLKAALCALALAALAGCSGGGSSTPTPALAAGVLTQAQIAGYWAPSNSANEAYEFFNSPHLFPYNGLKMGRVLRGKESQGLFFWDANSDGSIKMTKVAPSCETRPITACPVLSVANIVPSSSAGWKLSFDDNGDGVIDRVVTDTYKQHELDLSTLPQGEFLLAKGEQFEGPWLGFRAGNQFGIRMQIANQPVPLSATIPSGPVHDIVMNGTGEASAVKSSSNFTMVDGSKKSIPYKVWAENAVLSAGVEDGFILSYELHFKILYPADVAPSSVLPGTFETPQLRTLAADRATFVHGPTIKANDHFATYLPVDFDPDWSLTQSGNDLKFTSATDGVLSYVDIHGGKYSDHRAFNWKQKDDGTVVMTFPNGLSIDMRFIRELGGGYVVAYTIPDPLLGQTFLMHDLIIDNGPIMTDAEIAGHYTFISSDGVSINEINLHKNHTITGIVGGYWFRDTNGEFVGYECADLAKHDIPDFATCSAQLDDTSKSDFLHLRRLRFLRQNGNQLLVKYTADVYGGRFTAHGRDYTTVALTYRFKRVGDD
ncbi:MAG: hypothetical protein V4582_04915 [Pseudomonadota bacterium]